jgi:hypothetical protein
MTGNPYFVYVFTFRVLNGVKLSMYFEDFNISPKEASRALGSHEKGLEAQKVPSGVPSKDGRPIHALLSLDLSIDLILSPTGFIDQKNLYI